ncbi:2'-5' RNA ligase family protein [Paenibacillus sp. UNC451MF]|uniref:2'-5' RNA ligase family protein n=1 Tax=Paenibacillus sp. UNC451MF TaxID=1449063 RepID=UPI00056BA4CA|nr:2'-5' RNA ligase family protein [Paenibacillus sp. UNC451MF]
MYGIAVFPSKEVQEFANQFRRRYDPHYLFIEPHLTIHSSHQWNESEVQSVTTHLQHVLSSLKRFPLHFNRFSSFYPVNNVVYMALSDPAPIQKLYHAIHNEWLTPPISQYIFTPHVTVAQGLGDDELHDVLSSLRSSRLDLRCTINQVELLQQKEDGVWHKNRSFQLQ